MSQVNVELVERIVGAYQQPEGIALLASGDFDVGSLDAEVEWDASRMADLIPDVAEVYRGHRAPALCLGLYGTRQRVRAGPHFSELGRCFGSCWAGGVGMSQENVEVVTQMLEAFLAGNFTLALEALDDEVLWRGTIGGLDEGRVARGHREVIKTFGENLQEWESHVLEPQRFIDAGDRVVVFWHEQGRGRSSGAEVTTNTAVIYTVRSGQVVEAQGYLDRSAALKAVGLAE